MLLKKLVVACVDHDGRKKREEEREKKRAFLENGGLVLEKLVASCNGRPIPIRTFSYQELILATNSFDPRLILCRRRSYTSYKGSFEGRIFSINMYVTPIAGSALTDMAISAKVSAHKNILKLVGCCLETPIPSLVYEYAQNGVLADRINLYRRQVTPIQWESMRLKIARQIACLETPTPSFVYEYAQNGVVADRINISRRQVTPIVWQSRLKIARQIAYAIAYLHTGFSRPIIHTDINPGNIFLDQHDVPKLIDFSLSISIPEGETHVQAEVVYGTRGFICPIYRNTGRITEKTDVFSFGMVLLQLLTGQNFTGLFEKVCENYLKGYLRISPSEDEICDPAILAEEGGVGVEKQLQAVPQLEVDENKNILKDYLRNSTSVDEICDPAILAEEGGVGVEEQLQAVLQLILTCIEEDDPEIRPTMVDVTKELRRIERSIA